MNTTTRQSQVALLAAGDGLVLLFVTWIGFARHGESLLNPRWLFTFLPLVSAWAFTSHWFEAYKPRSCSFTGVVGRPALAMLLAAPLATFLRSLLIGETSTPVVFTAVMMGVSTLGIVAWRAIWWWICKRTGTYGRS